MSLIWNYDTVVILDWNTVGGVHRGKGLVVGGSSLVVGVCHA